MCMVLNGKIFYEILPFTLHIHHTHTHKHKDIDIQGVHEDLLRSAIVWYEVEVR